MTALTERTGRMAVRRAEERDLPALAALLAARHRRDRQRLPELPARWAHVDEAGELLMRSCIERRADGAVAERGGEVIGFLYGLRSVVDPSSFLAQYAPPRGVNMPISGHAIAEGEDAYAVYGALYAALAEHWVQRGFLEHRAGIVTADPAMEQAWFRLGFGGLHTFALRDVAPPTPEDGGAEVEVRRAASEDGDEVARFEDLMARFHRQAPVFWPYLVPDVKPAMEAFDRHTLAGEQNAALLAYLGGEAVGLNLLIGEAGFGPEMCSPEGSVYLYEGIVEAGHRGGGIGTALLARSLEWARDAGYRYVTLHWASPNLSGAAFWTSHGFRPVEITVQRRLDERLPWARAREEAVRDDREPSVEEREQLIARTHERKRRMSSDTSLEGLPEYRYADQGEVEPLAGSRQNDVERERRREDDD